MRELPIILVLLLFINSVSLAQETLTVEQRLGKRLFQDKNLSLNRNQSCSSCHALSGQSQQTSRTLKSVPTFVDLDNALNGTAVSLGSIAGKKGVLNTPSVGYATFSPLFHWDEGEGLYVGGQFWNGRAKSLTEQAQKPFLNAAEMAMPNERAVVGRLKENADYVRLFRRVYKLDLAAIDNLDRQVPQDAFGLVKKAYQKMAKAISAFEQSRVFVKFNSKFDYVLAGKTKFTALEKKGLALFNGELKGNCAACHTSKESKNKDGQIVPPIFTDFTYDNIGLPRNVKIPDNPEADKGLGGRPEIAAVGPRGSELGKHKVMSLRNIAITPPYGHNGVFMTLEQTVHFYNTRDTLGKVSDNAAHNFGITGWPEPEIFQNVNRTELGNLGLTVDEEKAIVAFMLTLTDDYPKWGKDRRVPPGSPSPFNDLVLPVLP